MPRRSARSSLRPSRCARSRPRDLNRRAPIALDPGEGEALWFNNDLLIFKATGAQTGGAYLLVEEVARRGKVTPLHTHPAEEETSYVLDGEALMHLDGEQRSLTAGSFVAVPPGVPHVNLVTFSLR